MCKLLFPNCLRAQGWRAVSVGADCKHFLWGTEELQFVILMSVPIAKLEGIAQTEKSTNKKNNPFIKQELQTQEWIWPKEHQ